MTSMVAAAGLADISAPLPPPRWYRLLDAANTQTAADDRWLAGAWIEGYPTGPAYTHDPCSAGTFRQKNDAGVFARPVAGAFTVYLPAMCDSRGIAPNTQRFEDRLMRWFEAQESAAVERVLADGDGHSTLGAYLSDVNMEVLGSGAVDPLEALSLLEDEIASVGNGMIHAAPATATYWAANALIEPERNQMRTKLGTLVAVGAGYRDVDPASAATPGAGEEWAFASGYIQITRSEAFTIPDDISQALDRSNNDVLYFAERHYLLSWIGRQDTNDEANIQAGVLIDLDA
jgi:hypothetical protein